MITWLTDTLVMTGVMMALVLVLRRPVGRWFGAGAAYALWALPALRLVLPPLALPRGLLPRLELGVEKVTASAASASGSFSAAMPAGPLPTETVLAGPAAPALAPVAAAEPGFLAAVPWGTVLLAAWLAGAAVFLAWRIVAYRALRRDLLCEARLVATHEGVRIIESPAVAAPLAFGVLDKVVALPVGFLASADSETSDFAIAHELGHHAGNDLAALILMQPLFALHWFNPLAWAAWRALRSDQEAACDARVMQGRAREVRARYGRTIASFAAGRALGLAAPMAGPLAGEKPIIHRLKALARDDVSPLRRVIARSLFAFAIVTVPATATISYAADEQAETPEPPLPPAPPAAPTAGEVPAAPRAPAAPPVPTETGAHAGHWSGAVASIPQPPLPPEPPALAEPPVPPAPPAPEARDLDAAEQARLLSEGARDMAEHARRMAAEAMARAPRVEETVSADGKVRRIRVVRKSEDGRHVVEREMVLDAGCPADAPRNETVSRGKHTIHKVCTGEPEAARLAAVQGLRSARLALAGNEALSPAMRAEILAEIDGEIRRAEARVR